MYGRGQTRSACRHLARPLKSVRGQTAPRLPSKKRNVSKKIAAWLPPRAGTFATWREFDETSRDLAGECLAKDVNRVLIEATDCDEDSDIPLRDTLTTMILTGMPTQFRLALATNVRRLQSLVRDFQPSLRLFLIEARLFDDREDAARWLTG